VSRVARYRGRARGKEKGHPRPANESPERNSIPSTGIVDSLFRPRKTVVFGRHFLKSTHVSAQAVAFGGNPLKRKTGMAGEQVDSSGEPEPAVLACVSM
jgi:hypothetical protein